MPATADFRQQLLAAQARNASLLCVGLDPEPERFPGVWRDDPRRIFDFCAAIVDATADLVCCFKPQVAHFAAQRAEDQLERLMAHIRRVAPQVPVILDAKRGDIGSTAAQYAREAFVRYAADAVTLSPFMGLDSLEPYMRHTGRGLIVLCRTSNPGGSDLQSLALQGGELLFERIARLAAGEWNSGGQIGLVVGATFPRELARVRALAPDLPILVPGVGAQGGDTEGTVQAAWRPASAGDAGGPVIVSTSRAVLYAAQAGTGTGTSTSTSTGTGTGTGTSTDFAAAARAAAQATRLRLQRAQAQQAQARH